MKNENKLLVIDIETTGFLHQGGSIVEIGIVELDVVTGEAAIIYDSLCREDILTAKHRQEPLGWIFKNSDLKPEALRLAPHFKFVKREVQKIIDKYPLGVTAFNRNFDEGFLSDRELKFGLLQPCPMLIGTNVCKLPGKRGGYKWPKVEEAWKFLFPDEPYVEQHRGADDALHEAKIVFELIKRGHYKLKSTEESK